MKGRKSLRNGKIRDRKIKQKEKNTENVTLYKTLPAVVYRSVRDVVVQKLLEWDRHLDEVQRAPKQGEKRQ